MSSVEAARQAYEEHFGTSPQLVVRAPGRVNLIGEHTDYNGGFVLPMAIDRSTFIALGSGAGHRVTVHSAEFGETADFDLRHPVRGEGWPEYVKGVAWALQQQGLELSGWQGVIVSTVPHGAGLSSSAALELAVARAFHEVSGFSWQEQEMAQAGQAAENDWVGASTGIMDQLVSASGRSGRALLIDCRSLEARTVPLPDEAVVVVLDTMTRHSHTTSGFNERRTECERAAEVLGVQLLRETDLKQLEQARGVLPGRSYRRARHVVTENARTLAAVRALEDQDLVAFGQLMNESHTSLDVDFEVTTPELNAMVACARRVTGCYGARMTGGGFGGSAVALVAAGSENRFIAAVLACYKKETGIQAAAHVCHASHGANTVWRA